jgi:hypothetical protein
MLILKAFDTIWWNRGQRLMFALTQSTADEKAQPSLGFYKYSVSASVAAGGLPVTLWSGEPSAKQRSGA